MVARRVFYNNSAWDGNDAAANTNDDNAIALPLSIRGHGHTPAMDDLTRELGKQPLLPGETASFVNYTSYGKGLNGIMIDFDADLSGPLTVEDFVFKVGNSSDLGTWTVAPAPQSIAAPRDVDLGGGVHVKRVTITWADDNPGTRTREPGAISNQWLQVTVLGTNAGMAQDDVFYFGNAIAESGNSTSETNVDQSDEIGARNHSHTGLNPAPVSDPYDYNRDKKVDQSDEIIAQNNTVSAFSRLQLITVPGFPGGSSPPCGRLAVRRQPEHGRRGAGGDFDFGDAPAPYPALSDPLVINVGNHLLLPNTADQIVEIVVASGGQPARE